MKKVIRLTESDSNRIVKKVLSEGSTWEGVKGYFRGKGYNYSKYLSEISEILSHKIYKKNNEDTIFAKELVNINENLDKSSADRWQKDQLKELMSEVLQTMSVTRVRLERLSDKVKHLK
jgi:hypothetical protein